MSLSMHEITIPVFKRMLRNLSSILEKAAASKMDAETLLNARLAPDMFPLIKQVQTASDAAKGCAARLAGMEIPSFPDTETTFPELQQRISKTIDFLKSVNEEAFANSEKREVSLTVRGNELKFTGKDYALFFALPNFFFHVTTAYDILRHNGLDIGKRDYLSGS